MRKSVKIAGALFCSTLVSFMVLGAKAQEANSEMLSDADTVLIVPSGNGPAQISVGDSQSAEEQVDVVYEPSVFATEPSARFNRGQVMRELESEARSYRLVTVPSRGKSKVTIEAPVNDRIFIPNSPSSVEQLNTIESLSDSELEMFLAKKHAFLRRFARVLEVVRLKPSFINKVLIEINQKFYSSASLIAKSNTFGGTVMFTLSGGLALPSILVQKLKGTRIGRYIPDAGGFYYVLGMGAGLTRHVANGRSNLLIEVFIDRERLNSSLTGIVEVSAAGTYGVVYEHREGAFRSQNNRTAYGGAAGVFREGPNQFGWAASTGVSFPPFIGSVLIYVDSARRDYIVRLNLTKAYDVVAQVTSAVWGWLKSSKEVSSAVRCESLFAL